MRTPKAVREHQRRQRALSELRSAALAHADGFNAYQEHAAAELAAGAGDLVETEGMRLAEACAQSRERLLIACLRFAEVEPRRRRRRKARR